MIIYFISAAVFLSIFFAVTGAVLIFFSPGESYEKACERRLSSIRLKKSREVMIRDLLKENRLSTIHLLNNILNRLSVTKSISHILNRAGNPMNAGAFVLMSGVFGSFGFLIATVSGLGAYALLIGILSVFLPKIIMDKIGNRRMKHFEEQFPEAMDLMTRALRSGHSFSSAVAMVASEMPPPISDEFNHVFEDYSYGKSMDDALNELTKRIELSDVKFFCTAVMLQRETGGNLTEILENISRVIRERFQLQRTVKTLSAEGKLSGFILALLAPAILLMLFMVSPQYLNIALGHPVGKTMLVAGAAFELLGILVIKKIISLKV